MHSSDIAEAPPAQAAPVAKASSKASRKRETVAAERTRRIKLDRSDRVIRGISYTAISIFTICCACCRSS